MKSTKKLVYVVFDRLVAPKGAAVHIAAFARMLGRAFGDVELVCVADPLRPAAATLAEHEGVRVVEIGARGPNLIDRINDFRRNLAQWWGGRRVDVLHFRSIFEGYPLALHKQHVCRQLVFEVNGLPSIELKYHHPAVADDRELLQKLQAQEQVCIEAADLLVTVSEVTAAHLCERGADPRRIRVIQNGVDLSIFAYRAPDLGSGSWPADREVRLLYSGTLAAWQGVYRAIEALELLRKEVPARLVLLGPATPVRQREIANFCEHLAVAPHVQWLAPGDQAMVARLHHESDVALAPLLCNDRNVVQGCCPLKVLEAMASGPPLVASDLPVVTCLARQDQEALLVKPGSAKSIKDAVLRLLREPGLAPRLSRAARRRVEEQFTWERAGQELLAAYAQMQRGELSVTRPAGVSP